MALNRMAAERGGADQILALDPAPGHCIRPSGRCHKTALAHRTRLSGAEAGTWARPLRGTRVAGVSPPRHAVHRRLRVPDLREGADSPLSSWCRGEIPKTCRSHRLPTPRRRQSGPNGTSPTRLPRCDDTSLSRSPAASTDVHAAMRSASQRTSVPTYDAVRLGLFLGPPGCRPWPVETGCTPLGPRRILMRGLRN